MTPDLLTEIGLNKTQAKLYLTLIESGALLPSELADKTEEKRTNSYMVLEQLERLGLVEKVTKNKKTAYEATNPIALEALAENRRKKLHAAETKVKQAMPALLSYYYAFTEKHGIRLFEGSEGIKQIYQDILRSKKTLYLIRGKKYESIKVLTDEYIQSFIKKRVSLGIKVVALTPDTADSNKDKDQDKTWLMDRTWIPADLYDEPVEINIFGDKTAFISFGEELFATVIDSPQIARALKRIINIIQTAQAGMPTQKSSAYQNPTD